MERLSSDMEQQNQAVWRRDKAPELCSKGYAISEIQKSKDKNV